MIKTKILKEDQIDEAVALLKKGELVALPTETVYGLAADAKNQEAIEKIFLAKGRPSDHPLILHLSSFDEVNNWVKNSSIYAKKLAESFWPGPLTMIFNKREEVSQMITGGLATIGIRVPKHPVILKIIDKLGNGVVAPSANAYQRTSPTTSFHVLKTLEDKIAAIVDGGEATIGIESTILDLTKEIPALLRYGPITQEMIEKVLSIKIDCPISHQEKVSGNMKNHYQPDKPLFLISKYELEELENNESNVAIIHHSDIKKNKNCTYHKMELDKDQYGKKIYGLLHLLDCTKVKKIFVERPPECGDWFAILDRLTKAAKK